MHLKISLVLRRKQTLRLPLEHHISGMRCMSASSVIPQGSKAEQSPVPAPQLATGAFQLWLFLAFPGDSYQSTFQEDFWLCPGPALLSFPTDSPIS